MQNISLFFCQVGLHTSLMTFKTRNWVHKFEFKSIQMSCFPGTDLAFTIVHSLMFACFIPKPVLMCVWNRCPVQTPNCAQVLNV